MSTTPPPPGQAPDGPGYPASGDFGTPAGQSPATPYGAPAPGPYGAPTPTPAGGPTASGSKTMGIASIVTGVLGLICCPGLFSVAAIITGYLAKKDSNPENAKLGKIGLILGIVGLVLAILWGILAATGVIDTSFSASAG